MKRWDVLGVGCATVDELIYLNGFPKPDSKMRMEREERQCGGLVATALVAAARMGASCGFAGMLGHGEHSRYVGRALEREGIDLAPMQRIEGAEPIHSTIVVDTAHHTRAILFNVADGRGAVAPAPPEGVVAAAGVLFVDHYGLAALPAARAAGVPVVADFERINVPGVREALEGVDHLIVGERFAAEVTGQGDAREAARALRSLSGGTVVVTCGTEGCWFTSSEFPTPEHQAAFRVETVDTTGCGDVFHGAYAACLAAGKRLGERVLYASAAAAIKATRPGAQAGAPEIEAVEAFVRSKE